ncbi:MAG: hypothetical protein ACP5K5_03160 [Candidatus Micrarchaeia archaeon]
MLAAFFTAITPFVVLYATRVLPDMLLGLSIAIIFYFYVSMKKNNISYFILGILLSLSVYSKTEAFSFVIFFVLLLLAEAIYYSVYIYKTKGKELQRGNAFLLFGSFIFGLIIGLGFYILIYYIYFNKPFFIFTHYETLLGNVSYNIMLLNPFETVYKWNPEALPIGLIFYFFIIGGIVAIFRRNTKLITIFLTTLFFILYILFGSSNITNYRLILAVTRYFMAIIAPLSLFSAYLISEVSNKLYKITRRDIIKILSATLLAFVIALYVAPQIYTVNNIYNSHISSESIDFSEAARYMESNSNSSAPTYIYLISPTGFNIVSVYFLSFELDYESNYVIIPIPHGTLYGLNTGKCNENLIKSENGNTFLFTVDLNASNNTYVTQWLNNSCSLSHLKQYTTSPPFFFINIYKVHPKNATT